MGLNGVQGPAPPLVVIVPPARAPRRRTLSLATLWMAPVVVGLVAVGVAGVRRWQRQARAEAAWREILPWVGRDLSANEEDAHGARKALAGVWGVALTENEAPIALEELTTAEGESRVVLVIGAPRDAASAGSMWSRHAALLLDREGRVRHPRADLCSISPSSGGCEVRGDRRLLRVDAPSPRGRLRVRIAAIGDRLGIVHLEGGLTDPTFPHFAMEPQPPRRTVEEWLDVLESGGWAEVLEGLVWIGGADHWNGPPFPAAHAVHVALRADPRVRARIRQLAASDDEWTVEMARYALGRLPPG